MDKARSNKREINCRLMAGFLCGLILREIAHSGGTAHDSYPAPRNAWKKKEDKKGTYNHEIRFSGNKFFMTKKFSDMRNLATCLSPFWNCPVLHRLAAWGWPCYCCSSPKGF